MERERTHNDEIDLLELFRALKKKALYIAAAALLGACLAAGYTEFAMTPVYTSNGSIIVLPKESGSSTLSDLQMGTELTQDYQVLATSRPVLERVIQDLSLNLTPDQLKNMITLNTVTDTRILEFAVTSPNPKQAQKIVNDLMSVCSDYIGEKMETTPPKVVEKGELPTEKSGPNIKKNTVMGFLGGLVIAAGIVILLYLLDDTIKSEEDIEKYLEIPMLAAVPDRKDYISGKKKKKKKKKKQSFVTGKGGFGNGK